MSERYYIRKQDANYESVSEKFDGVFILKADGMLALGKSKNVYTDKALDEQEEQFAIVPNGNQTRILYENVDITVDFIVSASRAKKYINVAQVHEDFIDYMTSSDVYLKSLYTGLEVRAVCQKAYSPKTVMLNRGTDSYILGSLTLHTLDAPKEI